MITRYRGFLADEGRVEAYRRAIVETVRPGDVVVDLGCGLGTYGFFALQAGASQVYAIDNGDVIEVARQLARTNGMADRIQFFRMDAEEAVLPRPADWVVTEIFGPLFMTDGLESVLRHARERWLKPGGGFLPATVDLFLAPVESPAAYAEVDIWNGKDGAAFGLDFRPTREMAVNSLHYPRLRGESLLAEPARFRRIDLGRDGRFGLDDRIEFTAARAGTLHGIGGWLEMTLSQTVRLTNTPVALSPPSWGHLFFPLEQPQTVFAGDRIALHLRTTGVGEALIWSWDIEVVKQVAGQESGRVRFNHSSFKALPLSREDLRRQSLDFSPELSPAGAVARFILGRCDGARTTKQLAEEVWREFPDRFASIDRAAVEVSRIAALYARA